MSAILSTFEASRVFLKLDLGEFWDANKRLPTLQEVRARFRSLHRRGGTDSRSTDPSVNSFFDDFVRIYYLGENAERNRQALEDALKGSPATPVLQFGSQLGLSAALGAASAYLVKAARE